MPDYSELYAGKYYKADDIKSAPFQAAIARVAKEGMQDGKAKLVLYFEGHERGVVLNASRYYDTAEVAKSKDTDTWIGVEVTVTAGVTSFQGKRVGCIEIHAPAKKLSPAAQRGAVKEALGDEALPDFTI